MLAGGLANGSDFEEILSDPVPFFTVAFWERLTLTGRLPEGPELLAFVLGVCLPAGAYQAELPLSVSGSSPSSSVFLTIIGTVGYLSRPKVKRHFGNGISRSVGSSLFLLPVLLITIDMTNTYR